MEREIYRKTEAGQAEIRERRQGLDGRSRQLLILANGERSVADLVAQLGGTDVLDRVGDLVRRGLLERAGLARAAPAPAPAASSRPAAAAPAARPAAAPPSPLLEPDPVVLARLRARVMPLLEPLFGPTAADAAAPLLAAADRGAYIKALRELQETLAIYRGKKGAAEVVRPLAEGLGITL